MEPEGLLSSVGVDYGFDKDMSDVWMDYEKLLEGNLDLIEEILASVEEVVDFEEDVSGLPDPVLGGGHERDAGVVEWMLANIDFTADVDDDLFHSWLEDDDIC